LVNKNGDGCIRPIEFATIMRLISMIQNGKPLDISAAQTGNKNVYLFQFNLWQNLTE
jgi:hypothetical protein